MILFTSGGDTKSFHKDDKWKKSWQIKPKRVEKPKKRTLAIFVIFQDFELFMESLDKMS